MKEVSLYVPCYNAESTIERCLEGIFKQTYPLKEILVIDDGSRDETVSKVLNYPVKLIKHPRNTGLATARNTALMHVSADYIASLDADCCPEPDWLESLMKRLKSPAIAGVGGKLLESDISNGLNFWRSIHMKQGWASKKKSENFLFGCNTVFQKKLLIKVGRYNEKYVSNYEDVEICERLRSAGYKLAYEPKALAYHFKNDDITTLLDNYWKWNLGYYEEKRYYDDPENFIFKIKDNIGLANRYIEEDMFSKRHALVYIDFLLAFHHSLRDFEYFLSVHDHGNKIILKPPLSQFWLGLIDLTFFYHFNIKENHLRTLVSWKEGSLQNFFALNLLLANFIQYNFRDKFFKRILFKHLFLSLYRVNDAHLLEKLLNLTELHEDWSGLSNKMHPNLNEPFLNKFEFFFRLWLKDLKFKFPDIARIIEASGKQTESLCLGG